MIIDDVYGGDWDDDSLHGASRNVIFDKIQELVGVIFGIDLGIAIESSDVIHSNDAEKTTTSISYAKVKEVICYEYLKGVRIAYEHKASVIGNIMTRVYVNGVAVGAEHLTGSTTYVSVSDDIADIEKDDLIQIYGLTATSGTCYVRNMKIEYTKYINNDP